jgi:chromosome partitioning protein
MMVFARLLYFCAITIDNNMKAKIITITNNKGGVGKTSSTLNIGAALTRKGYKVLLIDLDAQCNLSSCFGSQNRPKHHIGSFMLKESSPNDCLVQAHNMSLIPASVELPEYETKIQNKPRREDILGNRLVSFHEQFDFILIDCPPNLGLLTTNSIFAADYFITPMEASTFAYNGIAVLMEQMREFIDSGARIEFLGLLIIKYHENARGSQKKSIVSAVRESLEEGVFQYYIRTDSNVDKAQLHQKPVFELDDTCNAAKDYMNVTIEILERLKL